MSSRPTERLDAVPQPTVSQVLRGEGPPSESGRSLRAAYRQSLFWAVMFGAGEASFGLFASHLKAPTFYFGLLAGIPSVLGPLAQVVAANLLEKYPSRLRLVLIPLTVQALCFLPLAALPFLSDTLRFEPVGGRTMSLELAIFLAAISIYYITAHLATPTWTSLIGDLVPSDQRGNFFARMARAPTLVALIAQSAVGVALYVADRPRAAAWVFGACFALAFISRVVSLLIVRTMDDPPHHASSENVFSFWQFIRRARESNFVKFVLFATALHFAANIAGPYFLPYWIQELNYEPWQWVVLSAAGTITSILTMLAWGRFADRFGNKATMRSCSILISLIPIGWIMTENFYLLLICQMLGTIFWTGFNLSSFNYILEAVSAPKRARCVAYFNILLGVGVLAGSMLGAQLVKWLPREIAGITFKSPFLWLLVISTAARMAATLIFLPMFRELRTVSPFNLSHMLVQVSQVRSLNGIRFGLSNFTRKPPAATQTEQAAPPQAIAQDSGETEKKDDA